MDNDGDLLIDCNIKTVPQTATVYPPQKPTVSTVWMMMVTVIRIVMILGANSDCQSSGSEDCFTPTDDDGDGPVTVG